MSKRRGHIAVDFDKTLVSYDGHYKGPAHIGEPIPEMMGRVRKWLSEGKEVRIFTARADPDEPDYETAIVAIEHWCQEHFGVILKITNQKKRDTYEIWDDRAIQVIPNTGKRVDGKP